MLFIRVSRSLRGFKENGGRVIGRTGGMRSASEKKRKNFGKNEDSRFVFILSLSWEINVQSAERHHCVVVTGGLPHGIGCCALECTCAKSKVFIIFELTTI